jgi:predicted amidohydrolase YtcJ
METTINVVLFNGKVATLDRQTPTATALAIRNGRFSAVGNDDEVMRPAVALERRRHMDLVGRIAAEHLILGNGAQEIYREARDESGKSRRPA